VLGALNWISISLVSPAATTPTSQVAGQLNVFSETNNIRVLSGHGQVPLLRRIRVKDGREFTNQ